MEWSPENTNDQPSKTTEFLISNLSLVLLLKFDILNVYPKELGPIKCIVPLNIT